MEFLLRWEQDRPPELHAAQYLPVLVNPTGALAKVLGDLLEGHYLFLEIAVNIRIHVQSFFRLVISNMSTGLRWVTKRGYGCGWGV
jgi:hypothetical protein